MNGGIQRHDVVPDAQVNGRPYDGEFRILAPEPIFGAELTVPMEDVEKLKIALVETAHYEQETLSGYLLERGETVAYHLSRYPRQAFSKPPDDQKLNRCLKLCTDLLDGFGVATNLMNETLEDMHGVRVVLGLRERHLEQKKQMLISALESSPESTLPEVLERLDQDLKEALSKAGILEVSDSKTELLSELECANLSVQHSLSEVTLQLPSTATITWGDIFTVGPWGRYEKPVAVIVAPQETLPMILQLADSFHQNRVCVESLTEKSAYIVETRHCSDPDPE